MDSSDDNRGFVYQIKETWQSKTDKTGTIRVEKNHELPLHVLTSGSMGKNLATNPFSLETSCQQLSAVRSLRPPLWIMFEWVNGHVALCYEALNSHKNCGEKTQ